MGLKKKDVYNFILVCIEDFSSYIMVEPIRNRQAKTILNAFVRIIKRECALPTLVYCDNGSEFNNKLFTDARTNGFRVQFTIDR